MNLIEPHQNFKNLLKREDLVRLYAEQGLSFKECGVQLGVNAQTVFNYCKRYDIKSRGRAYPKERKYIVKSTYGRWTVLEHIGESVPVKMKLKCKCSCGKTHKIMFRFLTNGESKSCRCINRDLCKSRSGKRSPMWKGGKRQLKSGYIYILNPQHPNSNTSGCVFEHILVMTNFLGRKLTKGEFVHLEAPLPQGRLTPSLRQTQR